MSEATVARQTPRVTAALNYTARSRDALYNYYLVDPPAGRSASNEVKDRREVIIHSMRAAAEHFRLDTNGFELVPFSPPIEDIYDTDERTARFNPAAAALVKQHTGASEVRVFDPFLRGQEAERRAPGAIAAPAGMVHVDYTHASGPQWFERILGADAEQFRGRWFAIVNVWRPIIGPLRDHPLAVCDTRSVDAQDYMISHIHGRRDEHGMATPGGAVYETQTYALLHNPSHRWYYAPDMTPDEALLLKNYDSQQIGVSRFSPHSAFEDPTTPQDRLPRASIEIRALAIW